MSSFFKDLLGKSYSERSQAKENVNPFDKESLFSEVPEISLRPDSGNTKPEPAPVCYVFILGNNRTVSEQTIRIDPRIEEDSKKALDTFNHVLREAFKPHMTTDEPVWEVSAKSSSPVKDYSMLIIALQKVIEIELNKSVVPWMQQEFSIKVKGYAERHSSAKSIAEYANIETYQTDVQSKAPNSSASIPDIMCAIESENIREKLMNIDVGEKLMNAFMKNGENGENWKRLRNTRNQSAHTGIISEDQFVTYYKAFCQIIKNGYFTLFMDIKEKVRRDFIKP